MLENSILATLPLEMHYNGSSVQPRGGALRLDYYDKIAGEASKGFYSKSSGNLMFTQMPCNPKAEIFAMLV